MKNRNLSKLTAAAAACLVVITAIGCTFVYENRAQAAAVSEAAVSGTAVSAAGEAPTSAADAAPAKAGSTGTAASTATDSNAADSNATDSNATDSSRSTVAGAEPLIDSTELFSDRDLAQEADLSDAVYYTVSDNTDITINEAGVYVLSGTASDVTVYVEADDNAKVQLVLDGLELTNTSFPCIYVKSADKVFVTTTDSENALAVTGDFTADGDTNTDAVIFAKDDLVLNGIGTLVLDSTDNAVAAKDDLKITGGTYVINAVSKAFEANDSILISDGTFTVTAGTDAFHAENDEDDTLGYMWIGGGSFTLDTGDDALHANAFLQIDGGTYDITAAEAIESTSIQINDGTITIAASDDGINAAYKSSSYSACIEINGGDITITMGQGDTDGIDSNGDIVVNGGTIRVTGSSAFDYDGRAYFNGGTIYVNGQQVTSIPSQMMGGGFGGMGGQMPGGMNGQGGFGAQFEESNGQMPGHGRGQNSGFGSRQGMNGMSGQMPDGTGGKTPDGMGGRQGGFGVQPGTMPGEAPTGTPEDAGTANEAP